MHGILASSSACLGLMCCIHRQTCSINFGVCGRTKAGFKMVFAALIFQLVFAQSALALEVIMATQLTFADIVTHDVIFALCQVVLPSLCSDDGLNVVKKR